MIIDKTLEFELQIGVLLFEVVATAHYSIESTDYPDEPSDVSIELYSVDVEQCELLVNGVDLVDGEFITEILDADKILIADKTLTWYIEGEVENLIGV